MDLPLDPDLKCGGRESCVSRRSMLRLCLIACAATIGGGSVALSMRPRGSGFEWGEVIRGIGSLSSFDSAASLGRSLRSDARHAAVAERCLRGLRDDPILHPKAVYAATHDATLGLVADRCREDFRLGRVMRIDGWRLAETEVAICCLADAIVRNELPRELLA